MTRKESFKHAIAGLFWAFKNHPNFQIHLLISFLVLLLSFLLKVSRLELALLIFAIVLGLTAEMLNTAVEEVTDLITVKWAKQAKIAKDVAAGMVLLAALGTAVVGLIIFMPYLVKIWR